MLFAIMALVLLAALILVFYKSVYGLQERGAKGEGALTELISSVKILLGKEHNSESITRTYFKFRDQRFISQYQLGSSKIVIQDPELIKKVTVKDFEHFLDHQNPAAGDPLFSRNLLTMKGDEWKDMRSRLSPAFTSSKIRLMVPFMVEVGDQMVLSLKNDIKESGSKYLEVNVKDLASRYTNDVIASCAFGVKVDSHIDRDNEFYARGRECTTFTFVQILKLASSIAFPDLIRTLNIKLFSERVRNYFTHLVLSTMDDREKNNIIRPDMIHLLMEAKKGKLTYDEAAQGTDAGFATVEESALGKKPIKEWSEVDLVAQAVIFFFAGFDTVSTTMSFLLYELAVNPDIQERLVEEIRETNAKTGGKFDYNAIQNMPYLDMVVSEVLRKWPPFITLNRLCTKNYNMGRPDDKATKDFIVRKGELVLIPVWPIHRDPEYYPNPEKFDPERFSAENKKNIKPFTYCPFGLGPRNCIGSRFALCEVKVMAYQLLQHMEVSPGPRTTITSQLDPNSFVTVIKDGHWVRFSARV